MKEFFKKIAPFLFKVLLVLSIGAFIYEKVSHHFTSDKLTQSIEQLNDYKRRTDTRIETLLSDLEKARNLLEEFKNIQSELEFENQRLRAIIGDIGGYQQQIDQYQSESSDYNQQLADRIRELEERLRGDTRKSSERPNRTPR